MSVVPEQVPPPSTEPPSLPPAGGGGEGSGFDRRRAARGAAILLGIGVAFVVILLLRLWVLQVLDVAEYRQRAVNNGLRTIDVPASRGQILDVNGKVLVGSRPSNAVAIDPTRFPDLLTVCGRDAAGPPDRRPADARARRIGDAVIRAQRLPAAQRAARVEAIDRQLKREGRVRAWKGCTADYPELRELAATIGVPVRDMEDAIHDAAIRAPFDSIVIAEDIRRDQLFFLKERAASYPGVRIVEGSTRQYRTARGGDGRWRPLAAHLWGELAEVSPEQIADQAIYRNAQAGDVVGQRGVERAFDRYLRGTDGTLARRVNAFGEPVGRVERSQAPKPGDDVQLTIDLDLQASAENALRESLEYARANGFPDASGGAIVAMDPRTGAIRAIASAPTYNPARLAGRNGRAYWDELASDADGAPLLDRALSGLYPPGSTFKPVTAVAAYESGLMRPDADVECVPELEIDGQTYRNFETDKTQSMNLPESLTYSCNTFYYLLGKRLYDRTPANASFEPQSLWARRLGFGRPTGLDIGSDASGTVPDAAYKARRFGEDRIQRTWTSGDAVLQSIGQGDLLATPLQVARLYAMIANGGRLVTPHVGAAVVGADGQVRERFDYGDGTPVAVDPYLLGAIQRGLRGVVSDPEGTAHDAFVGFPVPIAGKTGTAEKQGERDYAWFAGYAPADDPELVVVAVIERGGFGGATAAPAARQVLAKAFAVDEATIAQIGEAEAAGVYSGPRLIGGDGGEPTDAEGAPASTEAAE